MKKIFFKTAVILFFALTFFVVEINNARADNPVFCGWYCPGGNYANMTTMTGCRVSEEWRCNNTPQVTTTVVSGRSTTVCTPYDWSYTCPCNYLGCAEYSARTCARRDRRGACIQWNESQCIRCNSNGGEPPCSPVGRYVPNTGTICTSGCLRISGIAAGTGTWSACQLSGGTYKQYMTGTPIWETVSGNSCTDVVAPVRTCGVCNATTVATATSISPTNLCTSGTATVPAISGNQWIWRCNGEGADTADDTNCSAPYIPAPTVDLSATSSTTLNLDSGSGNIDLTWTITNAAASCGAGCTCTATSSPGFESSWVGAKSSPNGNGTFSIITPSPRLTVTCTNPNGGTGSDFVNIITQCTEQDTLGVCDKNCGVGHQACSRRNTNCTISSCVNPECNLGDCPVSSEWREVKP